nr:hypothetical protein CFP56_02478 [Quercus suber]
MQERGSGDGPNQLRRANAAPKGAEARARSRRDAAAPASAIALVLDLDDEVHAAGADEVVDAGAHVVEVGGGRGDDVDDALDFHAGAAFLRLVGRVGVVVPVLVVPVMMVMAMVMVMVMVMIMVMMVARRGSILFVVDPEARDRVGDDASELAELLQRVLDQVLEVVGDDEEELLTRGFDEGDRHGEDQDGDDDGRQRVPEVPGLPQSERGADDDGEGATGICCNVQEEPMHVLVVMVVPRVYLR